MSRSAEEHELQRVVEAFLHGDSAQHRIVRARVAQFVRRHLTAAESERDDVVADVIHILFDALQSGRFRGQNLRSLNAYIYAIARLRIQRSVARAMRDLPPPGAQDFEVADEKARGILHCVSESDLVKKIYAQLNENCRQLLQLKFDLGWSDGEIAEMLQKSRNAISTAISRCIKRIQESELVREIRYQQGGNRD